MVAREGALALIAMVTAAAPAIAGEGGRHAVLVVDVAKDGTAQAIAAGRALRAALGAAGVEVLDEAATGVPLREHSRRGGSPLAAYQERLAQSEAALAALEQEKVVRILDTLVADLAVDQEPSVAKLELLEQARLRLASRLIGLGGKRETGHAETAEGKRAQQLLVDALRVRPTLAPSHDEYPARFFTLLEGARGALDAFGRGGLHVDSRPRGAAVFLEGRELGRTPLILGPDALPRGEYRLWVAAGAAQSVPTRVAVGAATTPLFVDLAFDGALWPEGPGLRPIEGAPIDAELARTLGALLGVEVLVLAGVDAAEGDAPPHLWATAFAVAGGDAPRRGAVPLGNAADLDEAARTLARHLRGDGAVDGVLQRPLPPSVLPPVEAAAASDGELPWGAVGVVAAGVGAALLVSGAVVAALVLVPPSGAYTVTVREIGGLE